MIFSNKARLLLDFSRVFQNVSPCEIMWKIKQNLFICLDTGVATFVKHDVTQEEGVRDFQDRLFFWFRINFCDKLRFLLDPKYLSMEK